MTPTVQARQATVVSAPVFGPATAPRSGPLLAIRLLWIDPVAGTWEDSRLQDLPRLLRPGDLLVVNDAATLPASLLARTARGARIEVRLAAERGRGEWDAVLFGDGDWRDRTEKRSAPPILSTGEELVFEGGFAARVVEVSRLSPRLVRIRFDLEEAALWDRLYRSGRPVQYSHLAHPLDLWDVQTAYAARPWAVEPPSAGLPLGWEALGRLRAGGVRLGWITHAAGLSSTGDSTLDATLPLEERYEVPGATARVIEQTHRAGGRVVAVGTTVVRALEGCATAHDGRLVAGVGVTDLRIKAGLRRRVVDGLLRGIHDPTTSHYDLLLAFAEEALVDRAYAFAAAAGYLTHEFGDLCLILDAHPDATRRPGARDVGAVR